LLLRNEKLVLPDMLWNEALQQRAPGIDDG
jgi:hypothetical protein